MDLSFARPRRAPLALEPLEDRSIPAGDVAAAFDIASGTLMLKGDQFANDIQVVTDANGALQVRSGTNPTTINGATAEQSFSGVWSIQVDLGDGDNVFTGAIETASVDLAIRAGRGKDVVCLTGNLSFVTVDTGDGHDLVVINNVRGADLKLWTGDGNDIVQLQGHNSFDYDAGLWLGKGRDILIGDSDPDTHFSAWSLTIDGGLGGDVIYNPAYLDGLARENVFGFELLVD